MDKIYVREYIIEYVVIFENIIFWMIIFFFLGFYDFGVYWLDWVGGIVEDEFLIIWIFVNSCCCGIFVVY